MVSNYVKSFLINSKKYADYISWSGLWPFQNGYLMKDTKLNLIARLTFRRFKEYLYSFFTITLRSNWNRSCINFFYYYLFTFLHGHLFILLYSHINLKKNISTEHKQYLYNIYVHIRDSDEKFVRLFLQCNLFFFLLTLISEIIRFNFNILHYFCFISDLTFHS